MGRVISLQHRKGPVEKILRKRRCVGVRRREQVIIREAEGWKPGNEISVRKRVS